MSSAVTLLTLDEGSILYTPAQMPDEVVLKHTDGELIKIRQTETGEWIAERRAELEVNFRQDGRYRTPKSAVAALADRQAFGFRVDGKAVNPLPIVGSSEAAETIEIEGLGLGGCVVEDGRQLPIAVFTTEETYYRITSSKEKRGENVPESIAVLERREGPGGDWDELGRSELTEAGYLLNSIAEETAMETISGNANAMKRLIGDKQDLFKASRTREDEEIRRKLAIQNDTSSSVYSQASTNRLHQLIPTARSLIRSVRRRTPE